MPGLTGRIVTYIKAKISRLLDRAEDPTETLDYAYERQLEDLQNVKKGIADVVTAKKRLQLQEESLREPAGKLDGQARQAMSAGQGGSRSPQTASSTCSYGLSWSCSERRMTSSAGRCSRNTGPAPRRGRS